MVYYLLLAYYLIASFFDTTKIQSEKTRKLRIVVYLLPMFVLAAFRDVSIGNDTSTYFRTFQLAQRSESLLLVIQASRHEPGYLIVNYLLSHLGYSFYFFQVVITLFIYFSLGRALYHYSENIALSCFLFFALGEFFGTMNTTRMWMAIAVLLFSIRFVQERKPIKFIVVVLLAALFHYTALIFILLYPLCTTKIDSFKSFALIVLSVVAGLFAVNILTVITSRLGMYQSYLTGRRADTSGNIAIYTSLITNILILGFAAYVKLQQKPVLFDDFNNEKGETVSVNSIYYVSMFVIVGLGLIGLSNTIMSRVRGYFEILIIFIIPVCLNNVRIKSNKRIVQFIICTLLAIEIVYIINYRAGWYGVTPYRFF